MMCECVWPEASLISRAVRISAIRVDVKWTVLSSAMGMFILTSRWREETSGDIDVRSLRDCTAAQSEQRAHPEKSICVLLWSHALHGFTIRAWSELTMFCYILFECMQVWPYWWIATWGPVQHTKSLLFKNIQRRQTRHSHSLLLATVCTTLQVKVHWCKTDIDRKKGERRHVNA